MRYLITFTLSLILISTYYLVIWTIFYAYPDLPESNPQSPTLRARFGTVMWHSSIDYGKSHIYCYYPKSNAQYESKGGEYIIKRGNDLKDCSDFLGIVTFQEDPWVSEAQKIWWPISKADILATDNTNPTKSL